jgi:hypothetical protein
MQGMIAFLVLFAPPSIRVEPSQTTIRSNETTITVSADGSILIKGPSIDLILPAASAPKPEVIPEKDPLQESIFSIYGGLQEPQKAQDAAAIAKKYKSLEWHKIQTVGDLASTLRGVVPATRFAPVRERISREIVSVFGDDPSATVTDEMQVKGRALFAKLAGILEECK